jgi:hypothetical protein
MGTRKYNHGTQPIAYLVKMYNIPLCLVGNMNQTRVHLMPIERDQRCKTKTKRTKHIQVQGKRKI